MLLASQHEEAPMKDQVNGYPLLDEETVTASSEDEEEEQDDSGEG